MKYRAFNFEVCRRKCWAQGHAHKNPSVTLALSAGEQLGGHFNLSVSLTPAEARAMAVALEAAATFAEEVIAETGLGESAVEVAS